MVSKWCHFRTISRFTRCNTSLFYNISCVLYSVYLIIYLPYAPFVYLVLTCIPLNIYTIWFVFNINLTWPLTMGHCRMYSVQVNMRRCACAEDHTVRSACAPDNYWTLDSLAPMWLPGVASGRSDNQNVAARLKKKTKWWKPWRIVLSRWSFSIMWTVSVGHSHHSQPSFLRGKCIHRPYTDTVNHTFLLTICVKRRATEI